MYKNCPLSMSDLLGVHTCPVSSFAESVTSGLIAERDRLDNQAHKEPLRSRRQRTLRSRKPTRFYFHETIRCQMWRFHILEFTNRVVLCLGFVTWSTRYSVAAREMIYPRSANWIG